MYSYVDNTGTSESFSSRTSGNELIILGLFSIERFIQKVKFAKRIFLVQFPWLLIISLTKFRRSPKRILKHFEFFVEECENVFVNVADFVAKSQHNYFCHNFFNHGRPEPHMTMARDLQSFVRGISFQFYPVNGSVKAAWSQILRKFSSNTPHQISCKLFSKTPIKRL